MELNWRRLENAFSKQVVVGMFVSQTGMAGYIESLTDPSYCGQILVLTYPLIGNYGVPNEDVSSWLNALPLHFESNKIHVAALIVAFNSDDFSHHLAKSSLSQWLQRHSIPAVYGIDTRLLTKKIRSSGAMLARIMFPLKGTDAEFITQISNGTEVERIREKYGVVEWKDPNKLNLVSLGTPL